MSGDGPPTIAILGVGGVGGLLAGVLHRAEVPVTVVARENTAEVIAEHGLRIDSVRFGRFVARPPVVSRLGASPDVLVVATKATGLQAALDRVAGAPALILPLLNGLDHLALLRRRFTGGDGDRAPIAAGAIRVEADRPRPAVIVHTSPFLRVDMATGDAGLRARVQRLATTFESAAVPVAVLESEQQVMWSKLVRLNALACTTSAFDRRLGEIREDPQMRAALIAALEEGAAVARAEGAQVVAAQPLAELEQAHATLGSSLARDIAAGRETELDAIPGAVLRVAARHDLTCPTVQRLVDLIVARIAAGPSQRDR